MRKFTLKPELSFAVIPGTGRVAPKQVLEGEQFARFVPSLLVELLEEPKAAAVVPPPAPKKVLEAPPPPPAPVLVEAPVSKPEPKDEPKDEPKRFAPSSAKKSSSSKK